MSLKIQTDLANIEEHIRAARFSEARPLIQKLSKQKIARELTWRLANLARRCQMPAISIQLLGRYVRPPTKKIINPSDQEQSEYAAALSAIGANAEALKLFQNVNKKTYPPALMLHAFAHITNWDYANSAKLLEQFLPLANPYEQNVCRVNLAAAYIYESRHEEAESILRALRDDKSLQQNTLLLSNVLHLSAHNAINSHQISVAKTHLEQAKKILSTSGTIWDVLLDKWEAVLDCGSKNSLSIGLQKLASVRERAHKMGAWETVRDCDYHLALSSRSPALFAKLYYGTPFEPYRARLQKEAPEALGTKHAFPPPLYTLEFGKSENVAGLGNTPQLLFDRGELSNSKAYLKPGQLPHRILRALISDFYRPQRVASLHGIAFPENYYSITSSSRVVREGIRRLRAWIKREAKIPLTIQQSRGFYTLTCPHHLHVVLERQELASNTNAKYTSRDPKLGHYLQKLERSFGDKPFSTQIAAQKLGISLRSARRYLSEARNRGLLKVEGPTYQPTYVISGCHK